MRPTGIVPGADAPTIAPKQVSLYLLSSDDQLVRRSRTIEGRIDDTTAIAQLLTGPTEAEKQAGLHSEVPTSRSPVEVKDNMIVLPDDARALSKLALFQLSCTARVNGLLVEIALFRIDCP